MIDGIERVGVYGGTFAPVHNGHVAAARAFYEHMGLTERSRVMEAWVK